jgi:hypothetical protein
MKNYIFLHRIFLQVRWKGTRNDFMKVYREIQTPSFHAEDYRPLVRRIDRGHASRAGVSKGAARVQELRSTSDPCLAMISR